MIDRIKEFIWDSISERLTHRLNLELESLEKQKKEIEKEIFTLNKLYNSTDEELILRYKHKTFGEIKEFERDFLCDRFNLFYSKPHLSPIRITCLVKTSVYPFSYVCETIESFLANKKMFEKIKKEQVKENKKKTEKAKAKKTTKKSSKVDNKEVKESTND